MHLLFEYFPGPWEELQKILSHLRPLCPLTGEDELTASGRVEIFLDSGRVGLESWTRELGSG